MATTSLIHETLRGFNLRLTTQAGVFSHREVDVGTRLLIDAMKITPTSKVLDIGCGYGAIGIVAAKLATKGEVVLVDTDIRATRLAQRNIELNAVENARVILGDHVHDLPPKSRFDVVVSNPPTHSGREVLDDMVAGAYAVLKPRGHLYFVINRVLSLKKQVEDVFGNAETIARHKGFIVIRAEKRYRTHQDEAFEG